MSKIYLISDMHFNHAKIIEYTSRPFRSVEEMNKTIYKNWNNTVSKDDKVFVLGDVGFFNKDSARETIENLQGKKHLIMGNHDDNKKPAWWREIGFAEVSKYPIIFDSFYILSHAPVFLTPAMPYVNIHGHIHHNKMESKQYFNVSVECIGYIPILFTEVRKMLKKNNK
jgi:calcineurin-like phosphoesterase family protein